MIQTAQLQFTREEASELFDQAGKLMQSCVSQMQAIERKHWSDAGKELAKAPLSKQHRAMEKLREKIGEAFNIGGY
jgi:hypothetical protein